MHDRHVDDAAVGRTLGGGRIVLEARLGRGGMGAVHRARDLATGELRAVKLLHPHLAREARHRVRFRREAEVTAALSHPHIVRTFDVGAEDDGTQWIAMELLEGRSLADAIRDAGGRIAPDRVIPIARQILSALSAAHSIGVIHRDLKPGNAMLVPGPHGEEIAKVVDFGIARFTTTEAYEQLTRTGQVIGTPTYMAPEQAIGRRVDARADVYAVGAILHTMLTGEPPYGRGKHADVLYRLLEGDRVALAEQRPDIPELARVVDRALAMAPDARPSSALALDAELAALDPRSTRTIVPWRPPPTLASLTLVPEVELDGAADSEEVRVAPSHARSAAVASAPSADAPLAQASMASRRAAATPESSVLSRVLVAALALAALVMAALAVRTVLETGADDPPLAASPTLLATPTLAPTVPVVAPALALDDARTAVSTRDASLDESASVPPTNAPRVEGRTRRRLARVWVSGAHAGTLDSSDIVAVLNSRSDAFARCWPPGVPAPAENRGRDFLVTIAPDGSVRGARPRPGSEEPRRFASCVVDALEQTSFPGISPTAPTTIIVFLGVEPPGTLMSPYE